MPDTSWRPFTPATVTIPTARLTEWAGLLRQLSVHVPLEGPALTRTLEAAQLMQWWAGQEVVRDTATETNRTTSEETAMSDQPPTLTDLVEFALLPYVIPAERRASIADQVAGFLTTHGVTLPGRVNSVGWDEKRARAAIVRGIVHWTEDPDRCDMEGRETEVADGILRRLQGDALIPGDNTPEETRDA